MQVLGIVAVCLGLNVVPTVGETRNLSEPIELVSAKYASIAEGDFVTSKRIAPRPVMEFIIAQALEPVEPPPPAMPERTVNRLRTVERVVDDLLQNSTPEIDSSVSDQSSPTVVTEPIDVLMDDIDARFDPVSERQRTRNSARVDIVDTSQSDSNLFIVPDPTDDQFITNPQPISIDFQDQLKTRDTSVETERETQEQPGVTQSDEEATGELVTQPAVSSDLVVSTSDTELDQPAESTTTHETELSEVTKSWTSLNETTREAILMLVQADRMTHK